MHREILPSHFPLLGPQKDGSDGKDGPGLTGRSLGDVNSQGETDMAGSPRKGLLTASSVKLFPTSPTHVYQISISLVLPPPPGNS